MSDGSSWLVLLVAKIAVSAGFVLVGTAVAERLGPHLGGLIAATPQMSIISLIFFTIEQGAPFAAETAFWTIPGMCATLLVFPGYIAATRLVPAPRGASIAAGVALGTAAFVAATVVLGLIPLRREAVVPLAVAVCLGTMWLGRRLPDRATLRPVPTSVGLLATRAAASAITVLAVTSLAHLLGPRWSGLLVGFPVNVLPVMVMLHLHYGGEVIKPFVKSFPLGAIGICIFNLVAARWLVELGVALTIVVAYAVDVVYLVAVTWLRRLLAPAPLPR